MKIFVISLSRSNERRQFMVGHLDALGLDYEFFGAIDGETLSDEEFMRSGGVHGMSRGEVGCYLSHLAIWMKTAQESIPCVLALEDDAQIDADAVGAIFSVARRPDCFDVVRLSALEKQVGVQVAPVGGARRLVLPTKNPSGLAGYLISAQGAQRLLEISSAPRFPVDTVVDACWQHGVNAVMMMPAPIKHAAGATSTITDVGRKGRSQRRGFFERIFRSLKKRVYIAKMARKWGNLKMHYHDC